MAKRGDQWAVRLTVGQVNARIDICMERVREMKRIIQALRKGGVGTSSQGAKLLKRLDVVVYAMNSEALEDIHLLERRMVR